MEEKFEDPFELEDHYHDPDRMCSMGVIEHEINYLTEMSKRPGLEEEDKDYFVSKIDSLNFAKGSIETNVSTGITTMESYVKSVKKYKVFTEKLLSEAIAKLGEKNEHTQRLKKRIALCNDEIGEMDQVQAEPV